MSPTWSKSAPSMADLQLIVDTAFDTCQVALVQGGQIIASDKTYGGGQHDRVLAGMVQSLFAKYDGAEPSLSPPKRMPFPSPLTGERVSPQNNSIQYLSCIIVTTGPGRFTGLRVGIAFARGLALVHQTPLLGINTMDAIAYDLAQTYPDQNNRAVIVTVKRGESFLRFSGDSNIHIISDGDLAAVLKENGQPLLGGVVTPSVSDILKTAGISFAADITEPSLDAVLACSQTKAGQAGPVRPYYAASYAG